MACSDSPPTIIEASWRDPVAALAAFADEPYAVCLLSDGERGRWSYLARHPAQVLRLDPDTPGDAFAQLSTLLGPGRAIDSAGPPFQGGVIGLASYELGDRIERLGLGRRPGWPDLICARYETLLAFDHRDRRVLGLGLSAAQARAALGWLDQPAAPTAKGPLTATIREPPACEHESAVAAVVAAIAEGEIFQANLARAWTGELDAGRRPFDLVARLATSSPAPFAAYLRLPGQALVSNSPERFLQVRRAGAHLVAETRPIKGTAPRGRTPAEDDALVAALAASAKDRAENLMIVDLMRNDLARVAEPGSVCVPELFAVERFANVSHLVSTVTARLAAGKSAIDLLAAAFPPGSITGAPKVQAMKVIARHEPPRGPCFGALFWAGFDGAFDSSVLIRTVAFEQAGGVWRFEARAGGGIVADSDPVAERRETDAKVTAILAALAGESAPREAEFAAASEPSA